MTMLKSFLRLTNVKANTITIFHDTNSKLSHHMLGKLTGYSQWPNTFHKYNGQGWFSKPGAQAGGANSRAPVVSNKFNLELNVDQAPSYHDYHFIHEHCTDIHPDNCVTFEKRFPLLFELQNITLCNEAATRGSRQKRFIDDLQMLHQREYETLATRKDFFKAPLIIDWSNNLIAGDDKGLDRIMANYLACGIQDSHKNVLPEHCYGVVNEPVEVRNHDNGDDDHHHHNSVGYATQGSPRRTTSTYNHNDIIHPHVAEFADLF